MKITLACPQAEHRAGMAVYCKKTGQPCAHQYFRLCKGWWENSTGWARCPLLRKEDSHGTGTAPA